MQINFNTKHVGYSFKAHLQSPEKYYTYKILTEEIANNNISSNFGTINHEIKKEKLAQIIARRLERIPAGQRQMFEKNFGLNGYKQLKIEEIARERNIPWKRVRMWINLALHNLQRDEKFIQELSRFRR